MLKLKIAYVAAQYMAERIENEYIHAKQRAILELKLPDSSPLPSNRQIKKIVKEITVNKIGFDEFKKRLNIMRKCAEEIMTIIEDHDPHLIGSVRNGSIRDGSDIDIHAYGDPEHILSKLESFGYKDVDLESVENEKGEFNHIRWSDTFFDIEITVYPWSKRNEIPYSSITKKPMIRWTVEKLRKFI